MIRGIIIVLFGLIGLHNLESKSNHFNEMDIAGMKKLCTDQTNKYEIVNLDSIKSVYLIYAKRNDSIIKIASEMENIIGCDPIRIGMFYHIEVESLLEGTAGKRHMGGVRFNNTLIRLEGGKIIWDLFVTSNLKGLCYIPTKDYEK